MQPLPGTPQRGVVAECDVSAPRRSTESTNPITIPTEPPNAEITALNGVIVPALEAALHRRTYNLNASLSRNGKINTTSSTIDDKWNIKHQYAHEKLRKLVIKAAGVFGEIEKWDKDAPVDMGGDVHAFLEGFLEEVLVRVEAEDE